MNPARKQSVIAIVASVMVVGSGSSAGASCAVFEIGSGFRDSRAVFIGEVLATRVVRSKAQTVATIRVERRWKGPRGKTIEVSTCGGGDAVCTISIDFQVGGAYLIFAEGRPLATSDCMAWPVEEAKEQLQWLQPHPSSRP